MVLSSSTLTLALSAPAPLVLCSRSLPPATSHAAQGKLFALVQPLTPGPHAASYEIR